MAFETPEIVKFFENPSLLPQETGKPATQAAAPPVGWAGVSHGKLQLNDLLFDIPPEQIQIAQHYSNLELPLLRAKENSTLKSGHGDYYLSFPLLFAEHDGLAAWNVINRKLVPLIAQFRKTPFCLVENELVRKTLFPGTYDDQRGHRQELAKNMAFSLVNMTVATVEGLPGALEARLNLIHFNYFPFSEKFTFRRHWDSRNLTFKEVASAEEAERLSQLYNQQAIEVYNPQESAAWKAFYQYGWDFDRRQLTGDLSNDFSLEFTLLNTRSDRPTSYKAVWKATELVPVHLSVNFENRIAKLPILNWVYATHQYLGGMNRTLTAVFLMDSEKRQELEYLQYLVKSEQEQTASYRYLSQYWGIKITNDVARLCGIDYVVVEDLNVDTVPGHPGLLQVTLTLLEHHLKYEGMRPITQIPRLDGVLQQTLDRLMRLAQDMDLIRLSQQWELEEDAPMPVNPEDDVGQLAERVKIPVWRRRTDINFGGAIANTFFQGLGRYGDVLINLLNERPNRQEPLPRLPGREVEGNEAEYRYYDRLRSLLKAALAGPLKQDKRFDDLRKAAFNIEGNYAGNLCYPDLDLPPHPVTGRIMDTDPDCYFYNKSDSRPVNLEKAFGRGLEIITQAFASAKNVTEGSGGLGWDYQVTGGGSVPYTGGVKPLRPSQVGRATAYQDFINKYAQQYGLDPGLVAAVIQQESQFNPSATSPKGAMGLMQLMPETARSLGCADPYDPEQNIAAGCKYLSQLLNSFGGSIDLALAAYNAGPGNVRQYNGIPPFPETQQYVANVKAYYQTNQFGSQDISVSPNPVFQVPVGGYVSSDFYDSRDNGARLHSGIDIAAPAGTPISAPTDLTITQVGNSASYGNYVYATDSLGNTHMFGHLQEQPNLLVGQQVPQGGIIGLVGNTGNSSGSHLDWKVRGPDGQYLDIARLMGLKKGDTAKGGGTSGPIPVGVGGLPGLALGGPNTSERSFAGWDHPPDNPGGNAPLTSLKLDVNKLGYGGSKDLSYGGQVIQQVIGQELRPKYHDAQDLGPQGARELFTAFANTYTDETLSLRRAYPTFALYFNDEFRHSVVFMNNTYGWGAVKEIKLIRSRKNPVDTLVVQLSNARGDLFTQQFNTLSGQDREAGISFNRQVIKEGTDVELRLGYHNNPDRLETVFTGKITEIEGHNSALITIVCQSYAIELFQTEYGDDPTAKMGWFNSDTKEIISTLLVLPECAHLGRWDPQQVVQPGEGGAYAASMGRWFFRFFPNPTDNNVFVPDKGVMETAMQGFWHWWKTSSLWDMSLSSIFPFAWLHYVPYRQLPWEIIEEMTLRHPGYIASVVPYKGKGSHKATLFFGVPCQNYYYRAVDDAEAAYLREMPAWIADPVHAGLYFERPAHEANTMVQRARMRPFRQYFYVDSEHHLIDNGLITSARDTFNAVEIEYVNDATQAMDSSRGNPDPSSFYTTGTYKLKANDMIREDFCRWFHSRERNCEGPEWANKYAVGYLYRHLKDLYTGEILITGEPQLKPYDVVFLYDSYNDVSGPIEVEQVTHIFSQETGFVTSIIPDLCVQTNEYASASLIDAVGMYFGALWLGLNAEKAKFGSGDPDALDLADLPWTGLPNTQVVKIQTPVTEQLLAAAGASGTIVHLLAGGPVGIPLSILMSFGSLVLFNWARKLNPIRITPVIWKGRPFICGLDGFTLDTAWGHAGNGLRRAFKGLGEFLEHAKATVNYLLGSRSF